MAAGRNIRLREPGIIVAPLAFFNAERDIEIRKARGIIVVNDDHDFDVDEVASAIAGDSTVTEVEKATGFGEAQAEDADE